LVDYTLHSMDAASGYNLGNRNTGPVELVLGVNK